MLIMIQVRCTFTGACRQLWPVPLALCISGLQIRVYLMRSCRLTMALKWTVSTEIEFSSSHCLDSYDGMCSRVHGHNWVLRVYYEFVKTDDRGFTIDYLDLKADLERVILPRFDHRHLNDIEPFDRISPTSENMAAEIFKICREELVFEGGRLKEIELWETPKDMVRYGE
jgi:6-pyruvoyltetrahydropterin/6-carboxytetrahydropterin synthase